MCIHRTRLSGLPSSHVWPFQHFFSTEKAAYLLRQHIFSNLYHRLSTRPFLASIEKVHHRPPTCFTLSKRMWGPVHELLLSWLSSDRCSGLFQSSEGITDTVLAE